MLLKADLHVIFLIQIILLNMKSLSYIYSINFFFGATMKKWSNSLFAILQQVGKSLMLPVSVLPAAGLLVALGRLLENFLIGKIMFSGGIAIFEQLPVVFAIGVAIGFTNGAAVAGLASAVGYFTLLNVLKVMTDARGLTLAINTGVFGGIIIGLMSSYLYEKFNQTKLHPVFGFFSGKRLVPIITAAGAILVGLLLSFIWPPIQSAINSFGAMAMNSHLGPAFYAAGKRLLIPVGLHHVYYPPFLYEFGEYITNTGKALHGDSARYFAGDISAGRFMASEYPIMIFGLPMAAFAMYLRAPSNKKKAVGGIMLTAALTSIITGITEPIEFAFIFVAPILYVFHVFAAFISGLLTGLFDVHLGYTFSASLIDYAVGFFNQKNSFYFWIIIGPAIGATYFGFFYWLIGLLDIKTPGREMDNELDQQNIQSSEKSSQILAALGGSENILSIDACITRLRLTIKNTKLINQEKLKALGAAGTMIAGSSVQVIFGVESDSLKDQIKALMSKCIYAYQMPLEGEVLALASVPDQTFAEKILGDGYAVRPINGVVRSPAHAKVVQLFHTNHAIGLETRDGLEILIHIGIDTVSMKGEGFQSFVKVGDIVEVGDKLIEFDLELVRQKAKSDITPVIITNMDKVKSFHVKTEQNLKFKDTVIQFELN
jgi:glucose-specific phosphotransferase system IIA component